MAQTSNCTNSKREAMEEKKSKKRRRESSSSRSNSEGKLSKTCRQNTQNPVSGKDLEITKKKRKSKRSSSESSNDSCSGRSGHKKKKKKTNGKHDRDRGKVKKRKKEKKKKKQEKKDKKRRRKETAIEKEKDQDTSQSAPETLSQALPKRKPMVPMTKEEFEKQQSQLRRVYDPETGRTRLVKGTGEILEEIVSKDRHKAINKAATQGDGASFQANLGLKDR